MGTAEDPVHQKYPPMPKLTGDPEEQVQYDHDTAHAREILEDYFTGVPWQTMRYPRAVGLNSMIFPSLFHEFRQNRLSELQRLLAWLHANPARDPELQ